MERGDKFIDSVEKEKKKERSLSKSTTTLSKDVDRYTKCRQNSNDVSTLIFSCDRQRISKQNRIRASEIAVKHNRKSFNEVLDFLFFCYEIVEDVSERLNVPISKIPEELDKYLPRSLEDKIDNEVYEFLAKLGVNGNNITPLAFSISKLIKAILIHKKSANDVLKPFLQGDGLW